MIERFWRFVGIGVAHRFRVARWINPDAGRLTVILAHREPAAATRFQPCRPNACPGRLSAAAWPPRTARVRLRWRRSGTRPRPASGSVARRSNAETTSAPRPCASAPTRNIDAPPRSRESGGAPPAATVPTTARDAERAAASSSATSTPSVTASRRIDPAEARTTLGFHASTAPLVRTTPAQPGRLRNPQQRARVARVLEPDEYEHRSRLCGCALEHRRQLGAGLVRDCHDRLRVDEIQHLAQRPLGDCGDLHAPLSTRPDQLAVRVRFPSREPRAEFLRSAPRRRGRARRAGTGARCDASCGASRGAAAVAEQGPRASAGSAGGLLRGCLRRRGRSPRVHRTRRRR